MRKRYLQSALVVGALLFVSSSSSEAQIFTRQEHCPFQDLFDEARNLVSSAPVNHSKGTSLYRETLVYPKSTQERTRRDFSKRSIPIVLLNTSTCELTLDTLTRQITSGIVPTTLVSESGQFLITVEHRAYGTLWNMWNTPLHVIAPEGWVVVSVHWKSDTSGNSYVYTPESADLIEAFPALPDIGCAHFRADVLVAMELLETTASRAIPELSVSEIHRRYMPLLLESIVTIEQADEYQLAEYYAGRTRMNPLDRAFVVIGSNPENAFAYTRSRAGARGQMQIMPGTCAEIRQLYKSAQIPPGCFAEDHSHPIELAAAALVVDYHLSILLQRSRDRGESIAEFLAREEIHMLLRASYNTGPGRVAKAVRHQEGWKDALHKETRGYLVKALGFDGTP